MICSVNALFSTTKTIFLHLQTVRAVRFQVLSGGECEVQSLLGCTAVFLIGCRPTFQRCVLPPSSGPDDGGSTHL
jgi:hypothetical protein